MSPRMACRSASLLECSSTRAASSARDMRRDYGERRWNTFGLVDGVHLNVTFTMRGAVGWIISARSAHRKERTVYDDQG